MITDEELSQLLAQCTLAQRPQPDQLRSDQEQRHERRWRVYDLYATLYHRGQEYSVGVYDLSVTGIGALNPPPCLLPGERAILALLLEEHGTLAVNVEVMHCADTAGSRRAGMQFVLQAPEELLPLVSYLAQLWNEFQPSVS